MKVVFFMLHRYIITHNFIHTAVQMHNNISLSSANKRFRIKHYCPIINILAHMLLQHLLYFLISYFAQCFV